jgi:hypothetical protein
MWEFAELDGNGGARLQWQWLGFGSGVEKIDTWEKRKK